MNIMKLREFHIWGFPDCVYVKFNDNFRLNLYKKLERKYGTIKNIGKNIRCYPKKISTFFKHNNKDSFLSVKQIKIIIDVFPKIKYELEENIIAYRSNNKSYVYNPILPIKESPELYNIIMHLLGDGTIVYYSNTCKELRNEFRKNLKIFGNIKTKELLLHTRVYIIKFPIIISHILEHIFDVQIVRPDKIPKLLFTSPKECKASAIRAIFDDEGSMSIKTKHKRSLLSITSSSETFLDDIKRLVESVGIMTGILYRCKHREFYSFGFNVSSKSYKKFSSLIGFTHPKKQKRIDYIIKYRDRFRRFENQICKLIEEGPRNRFELSKILNHDLDCLTYFMYKLRKQRRIMSSFNGKNQPYVWTKV